MKSAKKLHSDTGVFAANDNLFEAASLPLVEVG